MKKQWIIYSAIFSILFLSVSCISSEDNEVVTYPYSALTSFSIGTVRVYTDAKTAEGKDTVTVDTVGGGNYHFIIDQKSRNVYNTDSLPMGADVSKVCIGVNSDGIACIYVDSTNTYELFTSSDTLDFSKERRLLVISTDGMNSSEYKVNVNVSKSDPNLLYWQQTAATDITTPRRILQMGDRMLIFGENSHNTLLFTAMGVNDSETWESPTAVTNLPSDADIESIQQLCNVLYATAAGTLYTSSDGSTWNSVHSEGNFKKLLAASDADNKLWVILNDSIAYTSDGETFVTTEPVPEDFPTENLSATVYPLNTNPYIQRYVLVGYTAQQGSTPIVWSRLTTEEKWIKYTTGGDGKFNCPALVPLTMLRYNKLLWAFGGAGTFADKEVKAFSTIYTSKDNGLTWSANTNAKEKLPDALYENSAPYAAASDNNNRVWILSGGDTPMLYRGRINRLSY